MTTTPTDSPPLPPPSEQREAAPDEQKKDAPGLSLTQIVASALAAVSTTVLLSVFGMAGTIIGAGVASVLTVVANYLYTRSIEKTHARVKPVILNKTGKQAAVRTGGGATVTMSPSHSSSVEAEADGEVPGARADDTGAVGDEQAGEAPPRNAFLRLVDRHGKARVFTVAALVLFTIVMGVVLAVELVIGKPLSDAVRGQEGSGTSISQLSHRSSDAVPAPTSPAEDPANVPADRTGANDGTPAGDSTGGSTGDGSTTGTADDPSDQQTDGSVGSSGTDATSDDTTGTTTDDGSGTSGVSDGTTGGTDAGTDTGTDSGAPDGADSGTDPSDAGTGSDTSDSGSGTDTSGSATDTGTSTDTGTETGVGTTAGGGTPTG